MANRFSTKINIYFTILAGLALCVSLFILAQFYFYDSQVSSILNGNQKGLQTAHLVTSRLKSLNEFVPASVLKKESNDRFVKDAEKIASELDGLEKISSEQSVSSALKSFQRISKSNSALSEDLFLNYRNIKSLVFNLYRTAWNYKWMTVAKISGQMINDLDNFLPTDGVAAVQALNQKVEQLSQIVTRSELQNSYKMFLFSQITSIKAQVEKYNSIFVETDKLQVERKETILKTIQLLDLYTEGQLKSHFSGVSTAKKKLIYSALVEVVFLFLGFVLFLVFRSHIHTKLNVFVQHLGTQLKTWIKQSGDVGAGFFDAPKGQDYEFDLVTKGIYAALKKANDQRHEDLILRKVLHTPYILVNSDKGAIYWNQSFNQLSKVKQTPEGGIIHYKSLVSIVDDLQRAVDPVDVVLKTQKPFQGMLLIKASDREVPVLIRCHSYLPKNEATPYFILEFYDLREERKRFDEEFGVQSAIIQQVIYDLKNKVIPKMDSLKSHEKTAEVLGSLKEFALDLQHSTTMTLTQFQFMQKRFEKESEFKKNLSSRLEATSSELFDLDERFEGLQNEVDALKNDFNHLLSLSSNVERIGNSFKKEARNLSELMKKASRNLKYSLQDLGRLKSSIDTLSVSKKHIEHTIAEMNLGHMNLAIQDSRTSSEVENPIISESIAKMMEEFNQMHLIFETVMEHLGSITGSLNRNIKDGVQVGEQIFHKQSEVFEGIFSKEISSVQVEKQTLGLKDRLQRIGFSASKFSSDIKGIEGRMRILGQIGNTSITLQAEMEKGFKDIYDRIEQSKLS